MSSILKALEKVEESNNPHRGTGARGFARGRQRRPGWVLPAAVLAGAAIAALATFGAMGGFSRHAAPAAQARPVDLPAAVATSQSGAATVTPTVQPKAAVSTTPRRDMIGAIAPLSGKPLISEKPDARKPAAAGKMTASGKQAVAAKKTASGSEKGKSKASVAGKAAAAREKRAKVASAHAAAHDEKGHAVREAKAHAREHSSSDKKAATSKAVSSPVPPPPAPGAPHEKARPDLRVTGIAWQKDGASSFAMVNGRSVQQGGSVEGYRVDRIFEDKVVFSGSKGKLEVPLGAGE